MPWPLAHLASSHWPRERRGLGSGLPRIARRGAHVYFILRARRRLKVSHGTIKKLTDKGFGFIEGERGDIFFHSSSVEGEGYDGLREGQKVEYTEGRGPKGVRAENVKIMS
jgi:cold shock protein